MKHLSAENVAIIKLTILATSGEQIATFSKRMRSTDDYGTSMVSYKDDGREKQQKRRKIPVLGILLSKCMHGMNSDGAALSLRLNQLAGQGRLVFGNKLNIFRLQFNQLCGIFCNRPKLILRHHG